MKKLLALITLITLLAASGAAFAAAEWNEQIVGAIKNGNFNQINIIAASHPESQGEIALFLLEQSQKYKDNTQLEVKVFTAATPFVGRIPPAEANKAADVVRAMLNYASNPAVQKSDPRDAGNVYLVALRMSSQPNIVAYDPNLHSEVLEAANEFVKSHAEDADKKLLEEIDLAQAGGAPEVTPRGVINPSAD